jgi:hypothetical protein
MTTNTSSKPRPFIYTNNQKTEKNANNVDLPNTVGSEPTTTERQPKHVELDAQLNTPKKDADSQPSVIDEVTASEVTVSPRHAEQPSDSVSLAPLPASKPARTLSPSEPEIQASTPRKASTSNPSVDDISSPRGDDNKNSSARLVHKKTVTVPSLKMPLARLNAAEKISTAPTGTAATTTTTTTTTTTATATTTTTTSPRTDSTTTMVSSPRSTAASAFGHESSLTNPSLPRPQWLPYFTGLIAGNTGVGDRGAVRRHEVEVLLRGAINSDHPEALFQESHSNRPKLWMSEFFAVAAPIWENVLALLAARSNDTAVRFALDNPEDNLKRLEKIFSYALDAWVKGHGAEGFTASIPTAAKAMVAELRNEIHQAQAKIIKMGSNPDQLCRSLVADLLLASLASTVDAPQPLTGHFVNYLSAFLGRDPHPQAGIRLSDQMLTSISRWAAGQRVHYPVSKFNPVEDMVRLHIQSPVHEAKFHFGSDDFNARAKFAMSRFQVWSVLFGMGPQSGSYDPAMLPTLQREFNGSGTWHRLESDGTKTDLTGNRVALKELFGSEVHAMIAQACCTQNFNQAALNMLVGDAHDQSPFYDMHGRQISPLFTTCSAAWTIARSKVDNSFSVDCDGYFYLGECGTGCEQ